MSWELLKGVCQALNHMIVWVGRWVWGGGAVKMGVDLSRRLTQPKQDMSQNPKQHLWPYSSSIHPVG